MIGTRAAGLLACLLVGCSASAGEVTTETDALAITNGTADTTTVSAVALLTDDGFRCSGTVVSAWAVLSAAHCFHGRSSKGLRVFFGDDVALEDDDASIDAEEPIVHPDYDPRTFANDVAMVRLSRPTATPAARLPDDALPDAVFLSAEVRVVGFGRTSTAPAGIRRSTTGRIQKLSDREYTYVASPGRQCRGDSGGPSFLGAVVIGVHSSSPEDCAIERAYDARVDQNLAFIRRWMKPR